MVTNRQNAGGLVGGAILIGLGTIFLLGQFFNFRGFEVFWPLFIVGMGGIFFVGMLAGGKPTAALAVPGSILSTIGLLLLFQNLTGLWETWAYAWTLIIAAGGVGIFIMGAYTGEAGQRQAGLRLAAIGLVLMAIFGSFFTFLFGDHGSPWRQAVTPVLLILAGLFLVFRRSGTLRGLASPHTEPPVDAQATSDPTPPQL